MTKNALKALAVLHSGGRIHYHSDNEVRLRDQGGTTVKGFGMKTLNELRAASVLKATVMGSQTVYTAGQIDV